MNTMPDSSMEQVASFQRTASADDVARFVNRNLQRVWQTRRMQATVLRPFRTILRPLLQWLRREHFYVKNDRVGQPPIGLRLRMAGWETLALGVLLAPLAFLLLLPLLVLIFPLAVIIGVAAMITTSAQTSDDDAAHQIFAWHAMN